MIYLLQFVEYFAIVNFAFKYFRIQHFRVTNSLSLLCIRLSICLSAEMLECARAPPAPAHTLQPPAPPGNWPPQSHSITYSSYILMTQRLSYLIKLHIRNCLSFCDSRCRDNLNYGTAIPMKSMYLNTIYTR